MAKVLNFSTIIVSALYLLPVLVGAALNQMNPNLGTGMGVAYSALLGLIMGIIATALVGLLTWRKTASGPNYWVVGLSFLASLVLFVLANSGALSRIQ
ncbi:MAG: hypothetical protein AAGJ68_09795 [Pseudomonadota bacterium]